MASPMARAQNSYMAGSTSPSSLIQTACFFGAEISVLAVSTTVVESANVNVAKNAKKRNIFVIIFMLSMYKDLYSENHFFVKKNTFR